MKNNGHSGQENGNVGSRFNQGRPSRPPQSGNRPPQNGMMGGNRPPQSGMSGGNRPPQNRMSGGNRPPQNRMSGGNRPPQNGMMGGNRPSQNRVPNNNGMSPQNRNMIQPERTTGFLQGKQIGEKYNKLLKGIKENLKKPKMFSQNQQNSETDERYIKNDGNGNRLSYNSTNSDGDRYRTNNNRKDINNTNNTESLLDKKARRKKIAKKVATGILIAMFAVIVISGLILGPKAYAGYNEAKSNAMKEEIEAVFAGKQGSVVYASDGETEIANVFGSSQRKENWVGKENAEKGENGKRNLEYIKHAIIDVEDRDYYEHNGVSLTSMARALGNNLTHFTLRGQGGSTITQQFVKLVILKNTEKTASRKFTELFVAMDVDERGKDEVLEYYINKISYDNNITGFGEASKYYFDKDWWDLSLAEIAYISTIPNRPATYGPYRASKDENKLVPNKKTKNRQEKVILQAMLDEGSIKEKDFKEAKSEDVESVLLSEAEARAKDETRNKSDDVGENQKQVSYSVREYIRRCAVDQLCEKEGYKRPYSTDFDTSEKYKKAISDYDTSYQNALKRLNAKAYKIYTTIDLDKQEALQQEIDNKMDALDNKTKSEAFGTNEQGDDQIKALQSSGVCIDNKSEDGRAYVVAIVGGRSSDVDQNNRALKGARQPGSSFKPLVVYGPTFDQKKYTPSSQLSDDNKKLDGSGEYTDKNFPQNADKKTHGIITAKEAVARSYNTIPWKIFSESGGLDNAWKYLSRVKFSYLFKDIEKEAGASISLGGTTSGVTTLEMASAFSGIANDGTYFEPTCVKKIANANDSDLTTSEKKGSPMYDNKDTTKMLKDCMREVTTGVNGTAKKFYKDSDMNGWECAGKTGTSTNNQGNNKDYWMVGFSNKYTTAVWCAYEKDDMNLSMLKSAGSSFSTEIWCKYMKKAHSGLEEGDGVKKKMDTEYSGKQETGTPSEEIGEVEEGGWFTNEQHIDTNGIMDDLNNRLFNSRW